MNRAYFLKKIGRGLPEPKMVIDDQDAFDIMNRMLLKHKACACDYSAIAPEFAGGNTEDICRALWTFCKENLEYREESVNRQFVSSPQTILARGYCDCKGYALFIGGVLDALNRDGYGIRWKYRFASDNPDTEIPGHVFVVVTEPAGEIWIDPVLNFFNEEHFFSSWQDRKISAKVAGCNCGGHVGATTSETGTAIMKISAPLAVVPVVGWIVSAAGAVVGGIITIIGSRWTQSDDVRWLVQLFQYYVQGNKSVTSDHLVNEGLTQTAQAYFSVVLGVPIGGRKDLNILQSGDGNTNTPTGQSAVERARNYLAWKGLAGKIPETNAIEAATIAAQLNFNAAAGSWAGLFPAPSTIVKDAQPAGTPTYDVNPSSSYVNSAGQLVTSTPTPALSAGNNKLVLIAAAAAIAIILIK
jgi:hypothetical protein